MTPDFPPAIEKQSQDSTQPSSFIFEARCTCICFCQLSAYDEGEEFRRNSATSNPWDHYLLHLSLKLHSRAYMWACVCVWCGKLDPDFSPDVYQPPPSKFEDNLCCVMYVIPVAGTRPTRHPEVTRMKDEFINGYRIHLQLAITVGPVVTYFPKFAFRNIPIVGMPIVGSSSSNPWPQKDKYVAIPLMGWT